MPATAVLTKEPSEAEVYTQALKDYEREYGKLQLVEYKKLIIHKDIGEALLPVKQFDGLIHVPVDCVRFLERPCSMVLTLTRMV